MTHPIVALQAALVSALRTDAALTALIGEAVFDAPPRDQSPPYVVIVRHDLLARDGDAAPGYQHRLLLHAWAAEPSRKAVLAIAERVIAVAISADLDGSGLLVTHRVHERTDTAMSLESGGARAAVALMLYSEPAG